MFLEDDYAEILAAAQALSQRLTRKVQAARKAKARLPRAWWADLTIDFVDRLQAPRVARGLTRAPGGRILPDDRTLPRFFDRWAQLLGIRQDVIVDPELPTHPGFVKRRAGHYAMLKRRRGGIVAALMKGRWNEPFVRLFALAAAAVWRTVPPQSRDDLNSPPETIAATLAGWRWQLKPDSLLTVRKRIGPVEPEGAGPFESIAEEEETPPPA